MKINWGTGIVIGMALFMGFIVVLTVKMMQQDVDLVTKDYYERGIAYEKQIESMRATGALSGKIYCEPDFDSKQLVISFPHDFANKKIKGEIIFFRPSDANKDIILPLSLDSNLQQTIPLQKLSQGNWRVQFRWQSDGRDYYYEETVII